MVLVLCVLGSACAQPSQPIAPSAPGVAAPQSYPSFAGTWSGVYERTACSRSGSDDILGYCTKGIPGQPIVFAFDFDFAQAANTVSGRVRRSTSLPPPPVVTGSIDATGELVVTEHFVEDHEAMDGYTLTSDTTWRLRRSSAGGLVGTVVIRTEISGRRPGIGQSEGVIVTAALVKN
jgi:hypothetical protein